MRKYRSPGKNLSHRFCEPRHKGTKEETGKNFEPGSRPLRLPSVLSRERFSLLYYLLFVICYLLIASCASSPKAGAVQKDGSPDYSLLPPGASIYLWADVEKAKPILKALSFAGLEGENSGKILDLTETAIGAFYGEGASRRFYLAGWGNYPNLRSGFAMTFNRDWKKIKSDTGNRYWYSQRNKLGVAVGPGMALASDGDPFAAGSPGSTAP